MGGKCNVFETILYEATMIIAQIHESMMHLNALSLRSAISSCTLS